MKNKGGENVKQIMSSMTQSVYAKKREYSVIDPVTRRRTYIPVTFAGGIRMNHAKYKSR